MATLTDPFNLKWRILAASVATAFTGLGSWATFSPASAAKAFGLNPQNENAKDTARNAIFLLGVRDLSLATALWTFYYRQEPRAMGVVILNSMILLVADVVVMYKLRRDAAGPLIGVIASMWAWIGWELLKL